MKKNLFFVLMLFCFVGCAEIYPTVTLSTSSPIFITQKLPSNKVYVDFGEKDHNLTKAVQLKLTQNGYAVVPEDQADIIIKGRVNFFKKHELIVPVGMSDFGMGFDRLVVREHIGYNLYNFCDQGVDIDFYYKSQVSLMIMIKNEKTYETNLNLKTDRTQINFYRQKVENGFNEKISNTIIEMLEDS